MVRDGQHDQDGGPITASVALSFAEDAFAVVPQGLEDTISTSAEPKRKRIGPFAELPRQARGRDRPSELLPRHRLCHKLLESPPCHSQAGVAISFPGTSSAFSDGQ